MPPKILKTLDKIRRPFFTKRLQSLGIDANDRVASADFYTKYTAIQHYIQQNIPSFVSPFPNYYEDEDGINPAYQNIAQFQSPWLLNQNEKRIWVLRSDFILATGIKNAYQKRYGYTGLADAFSPSVHQFINWKNRYGHPSLALAEGSYDGSVFYAGYLCQREGFLQVYLSSGRFDRKDLNTEQIHVLETYIAALFQNTYGKQDIVFEFAIPGDDAYHSVFFGDGHFPEDNPRRRYTVASIQATLEQMSSTHYHSTLSIG